MHIGTRRRTSYLLTASDVDTRSPTWTTAVQFKGAMICTQVPIHSWVDYIVGVVGGRERRLDNIYLQVVGLELMSHGSRGQRPTYIHTFIHTHKHTPHNTCPCHTLTHTILYLQYSLSTLPWPAESVQPSPH